MMFTLYHYILIKQVITMVYKTLLNKQHDFP